ncbi:hypothetical protein [Aeromonas hydrophila]|uniref:DUF3168 domain-containing protein n=2 Tax=Aeromonas hydrophila TaxID=644 RepID=A0AAX3PA83_AERHY|nr:hypothetical protein [Aeromonas hydrophila]MDM5119977.1 hypothetical protein [Aeromonas hydrophila]WEE28321.1 hypothetical protein PY771_08385 [Aeromonas hydrophila]
MIEAAIIKTIKTCYSNAYLGFLPEGTSNGVVVSVLSTRALPLLKRTELRRRDAIINLKIFGASVIEAKDIQHKLMRLFDGVKIDVDARGYRYEMVINVVNANDMFLGTDKFSQLDISVIYYEYPII